ncbi:MAG: hypothetical protein AAFV25_08780 [Bacteroidota bacterium]
MNYFYQKTHWKTVLGTIPAPGSNSQTTNTQTRLLCILLLFCSTLGSWNANAQCSYGTAAFSWNGSGSGSQTTWTNPAAGSELTETVGGCLSTAPRIRAVITDANGIYDATQSGTSGIYGGGYLTIKLDGNGSAAGEATYSSGDQVQFTVALSQPTIVSNWRIDDIDEDAATPFQDVVRVDAFLNGAAVSVTLNDGGSSTINVVGNTATAVIGTGNFNPWDATSQVTASTNSVVDSLVLTYTAGPGYAVPLQQAIRVGGLTFCCAAPPDNDKDGIADVDDLDDDNDGIPDEEEACPTTAAPTTSDIRVEIQLDNYGSETTWSLRNSSGSTVASGGPYADSAPNLVTQDYSGPFDTYTFRINDSYGDGICCTYGSGYYQVRVDGDIAIGGTGNGGYGAFVEASFQTAATAFACLSADPSADSDMDGTLNYRDADFCTLNANGVCADLDADGDGIINQFDLDSDNDGVTDIAEAGGIDTNGDGLVDYPTPNDPTSMVDLDGDGLADAYDDTDTQGGTSGWLAGTSIANADSDGDGLPNALDLDSDNDGIPDLVEVGGIDVDGDGRVDNATDADSDGLADIYDTDDDGVAGIDGGEESEALVRTNGSGNMLDGGGGMSLDNDGDGLPDHLDLDADNDGVPDLIEAGGYDPEGDGRVDTALSPWDSDGDGLADIYDTDDDSVAGSGDGGNALIQTTADSNGDGKRNASGEAMISGGGGALPINPDGDGLANHLDIDADNDGILDVTETGATDSDNDGRIDNGVRVFVDTDNDGLADGVDGDVGNDGILEAGRPLIVTSLDDGSDADNRLEYAGNGTADSDSDDVPDFLDVDADNDGIYDNYEAQSTAGYIAPGALDSDGDGLLDAYDADGSYSQNGLTPYNHDQATGDVTPDYLDLDSDADNVPDRQEAWDRLTDGDSREDNVSNCHNIDSDGDGLIDCFDSNDANASIYSWGGNPADDMDGGNGATAGNVFVDNLDVLLPDNVGNNVNEPDYRDQIGACANAKVFYAISEASAGTATNYEFDGDEHVDGAATQIIRATVYCEPNADGWYYYYNPMEPENYLFAIRNSVGSPNAIPMWDLVDYIEIKVEGERSNRHVVGASQATFVMERDWNVVFKGSPSPGSTFDVKFYFQQAEMDSLKAAADAVQGMSMGAVSRNFSWVKKSGGLQNADIEVDGVPSSQNITGNDQDGVNETKAGNIDGTNASTGNGKNYVQFTGLSSFSGGTAVIQVAYASLPVELSRFTGRMDDCDAYLDWEVESELNFSHYEIEWSEDGRRFEHLTVVEGRGEQGHAYSHPVQAKHGTNYYRLRMVDLDGSYELSPVLELTRDCAEDRKIKWAVFPNPIQSEDSHWTIRFHAQHRDIRLELVDVLGHRLKSISLADALPGWNEFRMESGDVPSGTYFLRISENDVPKATFQLVVLKD